MFDKVMPEISIKGAEVLSANEVKYLQQAIRERFPADHYDCEIVRFTENLSPWAKTLKLKINGNVYVVRSVDIERFKKNAIDEINRMQLFSSKRVAPQVQYVNVDTGIVIINYVTEISNWRRDANHCDTALKKIAMAIRFLHSCEVTPRRSELTKSGLQRERLEKVCQIASQHEIYRIYLQGVEYLRLLDPLIQHDTFCHNNLHHRNILYDGDCAYIIDWETAGAGDKFLDIANCLSLYRLTPEQENQFLEIYLGNKPTELELAKLEIMKQVSFLRFALGMFASANISGIDTDLADVDEIEIYSKLTIKYNLGTELGKVQLSLSFLKEAFYRAKSAHFIDSLRTVIAPTPGEVASLPSSRFTTFSNPQNVRLVHDAIDHTNLTDHNTLNIESLAGGSETATNYKVTLSDRTVAVRLFDSHYPTDQMAQETKLFQHAHTVGISPQVIAFDEQRRALITQFIFTPFENWQKSLTHFQLDQIAKNVRKLHSSNFPVDKPSSLPTGLSKSALIRLSALAQQQRFKWVDDLINCYQSLLPILEPQVLSHNSLSRDNILFDGNEFFFIDWENATVNDKFYDLAFIVTYFFLDKSQEQILLNSYLEREPSFHEQNKFYLLKQLVVAHLGLVSLTKLQDIEFTSTIPEYEANFRYFNYKSKTRHLLNLQTDYTKFVIACLAVNEIRFAKKTGKYNSALQLVEKLTARLENFPFEELPLSIQKNILRRVPGKDWAKACTVNKEWCRIAHSQAADSEHCDVMLPNNIDDVIKNQDRNRFIQAYTATFSPYSKPLRMSTRIDTILSPMSPPTIKRFSEGMSPWSNTYKVTINDKDYVIRLMELEDNAKDIRREITIMQLFTHIGVAPKIHYASTDHGVIIMDYVDVVPGWYRCIDQTTITCLGSILHRMDQIIISPSNTFFSSNNKLSNIYSKVRKLCFETCPNDFRFDMHRQVFLKLDALEVLCKQLSEHTICHHDFNVWNVLKSHSYNFRAIDWEFSCSGDRLFDLGSVVIFIRPSVETEIQLLESYLGQTPTDLESAKYLLFKQYACLHYIVMSLGICQGYDFKVTHEELDELPSFRDFSSSSTIGKKINPHSDIGHYKLGIMFIKQAEKDGNTPEYNNALSLLRAELQIKESKNDIQR